MLSFCHLKEAELHCSFIFVPGRYPCQCSWLEEFRSALATQLSSTTTTGAAALLRVCGHAPLLPRHHDSQMIRRMQSIQQPCDIRGSLHRYVCTRYTKHAGCVLTSVPQSRKLPCTNSSTTAVAPQQLQCNSCRSTYTAVVLLLHSLLQFCYYCGCCKHAEERRICHKAMAAARCAGEPSLCNRSQQLYTWYYINKCFHT